MKVVRVGPGRPRKFGRPSRAVTLTLPDDVIATLESIDKDLGQAVVRMALPLTAEVFAYAPAELFKYGDSAVIVVKRMAVLEQIPGVTLVPLPDGRALISLDESLSLADLELKLRDTTSVGSPVAFRSPFASTLATTTSSRLIVRKVPVGPIGPSGV